MRAVLPQIPPGLLEWRRRTGADKWDEMWDGVLHMPPMPNREHQDLEWALETFIRLRWTPGSGWRVYHNINVASPGGWPNDYRIPDLVLLTSPGDESYEKLDFYASIGVPEVWIIDRDSRTSEIHILSAKRYSIQSAGTDGWILSPTTGMQLRASGSGKLAMRLMGDEASLQELP
jgi:Uma2 family endonuclease